MQIFEQLIAMVAPHYCIECEQEGQLLCTNCVQEILSETLSCCALCGQPTRESKVCTQCRQSSPLQHIWVLGDYEGALERLIHVFKFGRARAAAEILAMAMDARLPQLPAATVIVPLPTAPRRVRQRGYDQAVLMARALASHRELTTRSLLLRNHNQRQLGASKALRHQQAAEAYRLARQPVALDQPLLLIDDVITTGASLTAAARLLSAAGYHNVMAVVAAKRPFKK